MPRRLERRRSEIGACLTLADGISMLMHSVGGVKDAKEIETEEV